MYLAENKIVASSSPSPFGTPLYNRGFTNTNYRYGFNGKEKDDEVKGANNSLDFGARIYDNRLGRFLSMDSKIRTYPFNTPYSFAGNSPIVSIDREGNFPVWSHYQMTYQALINAKIDKATASEIAHYASTYSDHPNMKYMMINKLLALNHLYNPGRLDYDREKYGTYGPTTNSQSDHLISSVAIHGMRTWWENITPEQAVNRALYGGTFKEKDGTEVKIVGAYEVINSLKGKDLSKLTRAEKKQFGVALHTIQDVEIHKGARWVDTHKEEAAKMGHKDEHPDVKEALSTNSEDAKNARVATSDAIKVVTEKK